MKKKVVVAVSGGFDPFHIGHIRLFNAARKLGDELVVIVNNDNWLKDKKGFVFMQEKERKEVLLSLRAVDRVVITSHKRHAKDRTIAKELKKIKPNIFANGGDANIGTPKEIAVCKKYHIKEVWNLGRGGKVQSSSWLTKAAAQHILEQSKKRRLH